MSGSEKASKLVCSSFTNPCNFRVQNRNFFFFFYYFFSSAIPAARKRLLFSYNCCFKQRVQEKRTDFSLSLLYHAHAHWIKRRAPESFLFDAILMPAWLWRRCAPRSWSTWQRWLAATLSLPGKSCRWPSDCPVSQSQCSLGLGFRAA
jgi:hypothetical protein